MTPGSYSHDKRLRLGVCFKLSIKNNAISIIIKFTFNNWGRIGLSFVYSPECTFYFIFVPKYRSTYHGLSCICLHRKLGRIASTRFPKANEPLLVCGSIKVAGQNKWICLCQTRIFDPLYNVIVSRFVEYIPEVENRCVVSSLSFKLERMLCDEKLLSLVSLSCHLTVICRTEGDDKF